MTRSARFAVLACLAVVTWPRSAVAHVGSPDVFLDGRAGPYRLFATVRPPHAVPGVADVEILTTDADVREVRIVPLPLTGPGAQFAPVSDAAMRSPDDPRLFTGHLWMMTAGAWQVRVQVAGDRGRGELSVPVPTLPQATLAMTSVLRAMLIAFMVLLGAGFVTIVSAIVREATLEPAATSYRPLDETPDALAARRRRGRIAGTIAACVVLVVIWLGNWWWTVEASNYDRYVYKPLEATATFPAEGRLTLSLRDPGWIRTRRLDDFVSDHDHLMHLFILSPSLDRFCHLHPDETATSTFEQRLPSMTAGRYELFGDVVHATGVSETVTTTIETEGVRGVALSGDDSRWEASEASGRVNDTTSRLGDSDRMVWVRDATSLGRPLQTKRLTMLTFRVDDAAGEPARDLELYMGMPGHAIIVRRDRRVFAHVHPSGSAPMAAIQIGARSLTGTGGMPAPVAHIHGGSGSPSTVSFPYGFPEAGDYRMFVQVKRRGQVETGVFDVHVE